MATNYEVIPTDKLIPYVRNARKHSEEQISQIMGAIKEFGFLNPIIIADDNTVLAGHGRLLAAQRLGLTEVPCVRESHLTPTQRKAYTLADNRLTDNSEWDTELLKLEIDDLKAADFDLDVVGFDDDGLAEVLTDTNDIEIQDDDFKETPNLTAISKVGDLWQLGEHRLLCGDSTNIESYMKLVGGRTLDITFTSPPYNIKPGGVEFNKEGNRQHQKKYINNQDQMSDDDYLKFLKTFIMNCLEFSQNVFVNIGLYSSNKLSLIDLLYELKHIYADTIIWNKLSTVASMTPNTLNMCYEYVHIFNQNGSKTIGTIPFRSTVPNLIEVGKKRNEFSDIHKATFPIDLPAFFLKTFAKETVLEPFCGTGTTIIAAEQLSKKCYAMELEPIYVDTTIKRWQDYTGKDAIHADTGRTYNSYVEDLKNDSAAIG